MLKSIISVPPIISLYSPCGAIYLDMLPVQCTPNHNDVICLAEGLHGSSKPDWRLHCPAISQEWCCGPYWWQLRGICVRSSHELWWCCVQWTQTFGSHEWCQWYQIQDFSFPVSEMEIKWYFMTLEEELSEVLPQMIQKVQHRDAVFLARWACSLPYLAPFVPW